MKKAIWNNKVIAESNNTIEVEGNQYFPPEALKKEYLVNSDTQTICPWKGTASFYHIKVDDNLNKDAAWYYPDTKPAADNIKNHTAFWKGVKITEA